MHRRVLRRICIEIHGLRRRRRRRSREAGKLEPRARRSISVGRVARAFCLFVVCGWSCITDRALSAMRHSARERRHNGRRNGQSDRATKATRGGRRRSGRRRVDAAPIRSDPPPHGARADTHGRLRCRRVSGRERASGIPAGPGMLIRTIAVRSKTTAAWGQVPLASRKHILTMCDQIIPAVMSSMRPVVRREEAQEHLNVLRARVAPASTRCACPRAPSGPAATTGCSPSTYARTGVAARVMRERAHAGVLLARRAEEA